MRLQMGLFLLYLATLCAGQCPDGCQCTTSPKQTVHCHNITMDAVLPLLSPTIQELSITSSTIEILYTNTFAHLHLDNLKVLRLNADDIFELEIGAFAGLTSLEVLDLSDNLLTEINSTAFIRLESLKTLNLDNNAINSLPDFARLSNLKALTLNQNLISEIQCRAFESLKNLKTLYIEYNRITELPECSLEGLITLEELSFLVNPIESIDVSTFASTLKLKRLILADNFLGVIPETIFEPVSDSLEFLSLSGAELQSTPKLGNLTVLRHLDISANQFQNIPRQAFGNLSSLNELFLQDMVTLVTVEEEAFNGLLGLRSLSVSGNKKIVDFPANSFDIDSCQNIRYIALENNGIKKFTESFLQKLSACPNLRTVAIQNNPVHCDCSAQVLKNWIGTSELIWAKAWREEGNIRCGSPSNMQGVAVIDVPSRDLTCDPPEVQVDGALQVKVQNGSRMEVSAIMYKGLPSSVWMLPIGLSLKPGEIKLDYEVVETVNADYTVTTTISKEVFTDVDSGLFTLIATNANSGTAVTFQITMSPPPAAPEDVMKIPNSAVNSNAAENEINPFKAKERDNFAEKSSNTENNLEDDNTSSSEEARLRKVQENYIAVGIAFSLLVLSVVALFVMLKRRGRDMAQDREIIVFSRIKNDNYGSIQN